MLDILKVKKRLKNIASTKEIEYCNQTKLQELMLQISQIQKLVKKKKKLQANEAIGKIIGDPTNNVKIKVGIQELQKLLPNITINIKPHLLGLFGVVPLENKQYDVYVKKYLYSIMLTTSSKDSNDFNNKVEFAFKIYDINNDKTIQFEELEEMLVSFNELYCLCFEKEVIHQIVQALLEEMDTENSESISIDNFKKYLENYKSQPIGFNPIEKEQAVAKKHKEIIVKQQAPTCKKKVKNYLDMKGSELLCVILWLILNAGIFALYFISYNHGFLARAFAKGFSGMIQLNMCLLLLFVSKISLMVMRGTILNKLIPPHKNIVYHKYIASWVILFCSPGHILSHLIGTFPAVSSYTNLNELNQVTYSPLNQIPSYAELLFDTLPGWTGIVITILMIVLIIAAREKIRNSTFELFWYTHQIYLAIYGFLFFHGMHQIFARSTFYMWVSLPCLLIIIEKSYLWFNYLRFNFKIVSLKYLPSLVIELKLNRPKNQFNFESGQYGKINIPKISLFQWHPFTISSSPSQLDEITFHISPAGWWTKQLSNLAMNSQKQEKMPDIKVNLDGPFGAPAQNYYDYQHLILVASGIGATPFASILREILHRKKYHPEKLTIKKVSFYWVNRSANQVSWLTTLISEISKENKDDFMDINIFFTAPQQKYDFRSFFLWNGLELLKKKGFINKNELAANSHWGRPKWEDIFDEKCQIQGKLIYGVFACGNNALCKEVYQNCIKYSQDNILFRFTQEVF